jgi:8-oxo-dGTP pyrophosphatase MutT (NUDIX family)
MRISDMVKKELISVQPIRYNGNKLEFLLIKRATPGYNWQCVTGSVGQSMGALDHPKNETPLECAKRELYEETGYNAAQIIPFQAPPEYYEEGDEEVGERIPIELEDILKEIAGYDFIALINQSKDPVLNPEEHTDWKWCDYDTGYNLILYSIEKKGFRHIRQYLLKHPLT